jgi:hypothetical protein
VRINQLFIPVDAVAIQRIPIRSQLADFQAWEFEKHRSYSGKSAYKLLDRARIGGGAEHSASVSINREWKCIWKLKVPPKVRVFWWRVLHEFLPTRQILHFRHVEPIANCEVCGAEEETI